MRICRVVTHYYRETSLLDLCAHKKKDWIMTRSITLARTLALSALATTVLSSSAFAKIEEGKLVIWINGDKGYNGTAEVGKKFEKTPASRSPSSTRTSWKKNTAGGRHRRRPGHYLLGPRPLRRLCAVRPAGRNPPVKAFGDKLFPFTGRGAL